MRALWAFPIAAAAVALTGCEAVLHTLVAPSVTIQGSGQPATVERDVEDFTEVEVAGALRATIEVGDGPKVVIRGDDNIVPLVRVAVEDGRLSVGPEPNTSFRETTPLEVAITATSLSAAEASGASAITVGKIEARRLRVEANGASTVTLDDVQADELEVEANGASTITAAGTAKAARLGASGASKIVSSGLSVETASVDLSGASNGEIRVGQAVSGTTSGASNLKVHGDPGQRAIDSSGASDVDFLPGG
jgi:hypothetical protein